MLDKVADFLIEKETITGKEFMEIFNEVKGIKPEGADADNDNNAVAAEGDNEEAATAQGDTGNAAAAAGAENAVTVQNGAGDTEAAPGDDAETVVQVDVEDAAQQENAAQPEGTETVQVEAGNGSMSGGNKN